MPILFYLFLLAGIMATPQAQASTAPAQTEQPAAPKNMEPVQTDTTEALNTRSLAHAQPPAPLEQTAPSILPDDTIAKGTGVMAPELPQTPVYNPTDER